MASNYTGNPLSAQTPGIAPGPGVSSVISIPAGTDVRTIESITQQMKQHADASTYQMNEFRQRGMLREEWRVARSSYQTTGLLVGQSDWTFEVVGTLGLGNLTTSYAGSSDPMISMNMDSGSSNNTLLSLHTSNSLINPAFANLDAFVEFDIGVGSIANNFSLLVGLSDNKNPVAAGANSLILAYSPASGANWGAQARASTISTTGSGTPPSSTPAKQKLTFTYKTVAGVKTATMSINGSLYANFDSTSTPGSMPTNPLQIVFTMVNDSSGLHQSIISFNQVYASWRRS